MTVSADHLERGWTEPLSGEPSGRKSPPLLVPWSVWADGSPTSTMPSLRTKVLVGVRASGRLFVRGLKACAIAAQWQDFYVDDYADFHQKKDLEVDQAADRGLPEAGWHL
jgi:hypothetical protein